jgi:hypothetical protein
MAWEDELRERLHGLQSPPDDGLAVSIKVRPLAGCSCREHCCPAAYAIIDAARRRGRDEYDFIEHETGPEILVICTLTAAGISLAAAVINLVTASINAWAAGQKKGDKPHHSVELTVRGFDREGKVFEEKALTVSTGEDMAREVVQKALAGFQLPTSLARL